MSYIRPFAESNSLGGPAKHVTRSIYGQCWYREGRSFSTISRSPLSTSTSLFSFGILFERNRFRRPTRKPRAAAALPGFPEAALLRSHRKPRRGAAPGGSHPAWRERLPESHHVRCLRSS